MFAMAAHTPKGKHVMLFCNVVRLEDWFVPRSFAIALPSSLDGNQ